ncbi:hypothetical protein [Lysobacter gummosus]|uniref:hypothetical protein n=1 Tax=Lysobacter gummosus TaxID=262324 RepID=UPI0036454518
MDAYPRWQRHQSFDFGWFHWNLSLSSPCLQRRRLWSHFGRSERAGLRRTVRRSHYHRGCDQQQRDVPRDLDQRERGHAHDLPTRRKSRRCALVVVV